MLHVGQFSGQLHVETELVGHEMSEVTQQFLEIIVRQTITARDPPGIGVVNPDARWRSGF